MKNILQRHSRTDGRTDEQTTCNLITALSRGNKIVNAAPFAKGTDYRAALYTVVAYIGCMPECRPAECRPGAMPNIPIMRDHSHFHLR